MRELKLKKVLTFCYCGVKSYVNQQVYDNGDRVPNWTLNYVYKSDTGVSEDSCFVRYSVVYFLVRHIDGYHLYLSIIDDPDDYEAISMNCVSPTTGFHGTVISIFKVSV